MGPAEPDDLRSPLIDPAERPVLERLLARHRVRPVHRLGQNFLVDPALRDRVAGEAGLRPDDAVLELGAGPGALTVALAGRAARLTAVELDPRLVAVLREVTAGRPNLEVVEGDILRLDLPAADVVAGNIPYYLTGALLPKLLDTKEKPRTISLVVQEEVARRWTEAGDWSLGSLAVQVYAVPELRMTLPRTAFWPAPAVDSALAVLAVRPRPAVDRPDLGAFFRFAERVFQFRRKQLGGILTRLGEEDAPGRLAALGVDARRRPQTLSLPEWEAVHREFGP